MADHPPLTRLAPAPAGPTTVDDAYAVDRPAPGRRPWVTVCMIASVDGATAVAGRSGGLGNATDRAVLGAMRRAADVVLVGAGTAAAEGYGPPRKAGQRIGVVTRSGRLDPDAELFRSGAGFAIAPRTTPVPAGIEVLRAGTDSVDLAAALAGLHRVVPGVAVVSAEGGATFNGALLDADLVDEVTVTIAPLLAGGASSRLVRGAQERLRHLHLAHLLMDAEDFLFARYVRSAT